MARYHTMSLMLAVLMIASSASGQPEVAPELRWRDPVPEYSPEVLCTGECMIEWREVASLTDEAEAITRFRRKYGLLDWLRDLVALDDP